MYKSLLIIFNILILSYSSFSQSKNKQVLYDNWPTTRSSNSIIDRKSDDVTMNFVPIGNIWNHNIITYFFQNGTSDINTDDERQAVRDGFSLWSNSTNLVFLEVCNATDADIVIFWGIFNHGDAGAFDGTGGVLAHTLGGPPPNTFGAQAGDIHFDDSETWSLNVRNSNEQPIDLTTVAAHEIGHALGLDHTQVSGSLMLASYTGSHRFLGSDDIAGIQSLYGTPDNNFYIIGPSQICNTSETYTIQNLPAGATLTWSVTPSSGVVSSSTSGNSITLTKTGNGLVNLSAVVTTGCGNINLQSKSIIVGEPNGDYNFGTITTNLYGSQPLYNGSCLVLNNNSNYPNMYNAEVNMSNLGATSYHWSLVSKSPANAIAQVLDNGGGNATINLRPAGSHITVKVVISNPCGISNQIYTLGTNCFPL